MPFGSAPAPLLRALVFLVFWENINAYKIHEGLETLIVHLLEPIEPIQIWDVCTIIGVMNRMLALQHSPPWFVIAKTWKPAPPPHTSISSTMNKSMLGIITWWYLKELKKLRWLCVTALLVVTHIHDQKWHKKNLNGSESKNQVNPLV